MHKLVVYDMKGIKTKNNRDVVFAIFDLFINVDTSAGHPVVTKPLTEQDVLLITRTAVSSKT